MKPINLLLIFAMVALGIVFGAIPGLSATLGIALLLPITYPAGRVQRRAYIRELANFCRA